ncbi:MAG: DUF975 family protein [Oscillospiraceae bacterium]|nr:DUF975 family protein [Oscillospiraceae bacterium]
MWEFKTLKQNAWNVLKKFGYWTPFLVCLVTSLVAGGSSGGSSAASSSGSYEEGETSFLDSIIPGFENLMEDPTFQAIFIGTIIIICLFAIVFALAWGAFLSGPIVVGKNRFFMEHRAYGSKFTKLFWGFGCGSYLNIVKVMFWCEIKIVLWTLLFIIPGIIKSYEYFMVPYILAENPNMKSEDVFELSKQMTKGEKMSIFLLQLSFIGWMLLCILTCGIGYFFLNPYMEATYAELYQVMREKAKAYNFPCSEKLTGFYPENEQQ